MPDKDSSEPCLDRTVVKICPACGVVNPAGPSGGCPHLQLVRFDGIDDGLGEMLSSVAEARRQYLELSDRLKREVRDAVKDGRAEVETTRRARASELEGVLDAMNGDGLRLTHPDPPRRMPAKPKARPKRKRAGPPPVDPRQLELLAQSPPKGDA